MEQKETHSDNLFQEFQSSYNEADPEEKKRLAARFLPWFEKQVNLLSDLSAPTDFRDQEHSKPLESSINDQDSNWKNLHKLIDNEIDLTKIAKNIEQVLWVRDISSGRILYASPAFEKVWGRSLESLYADPSILIESVHAEDRLQVMVSNPLQIDDKPITQIYRILRPDGSLRWISARTFLAQDKTSEPDYLFCVAEDITDQRQIELAMRKTLDRIRGQYDISRKMSLARKPQAVLKTLMSAHELRSAQHAVLLLFNEPKTGPTGGVELTASWVSNQSSFHWPDESNLYEEPALWDLFQPNRTVIITDIQSDSRLPPHLRDLLNEANNQTLVIFPLVSLKNWLGCLLVYYKKVHHFDHNELRHLKVFVDQATITLYNLQLLTTEEELRHDAERANEIKTEFLAMISHELRTPLTSIIGFTSTLLAEDVKWEPNERRDFIWTIQREAKRLQELIDHLLDLSRLEAGVLPISLEAHYLQEVVRDALPQIQTLTSEHTLTIQLPDNLPQVFVDAKRIAQILVNLVRNASTYSPKGTEIRISAKARKGFVQISVSDQGPGIHLTERKRVFKAFQRGVNVENDVPHGAGLGLAICKGLTEAHGGHIWIKGQTLPGTTVSFTIPLVPARTLANPVEKE